MTIEEIIIGLLQTAPYMLIKVFSVILLLLHLSFAFVLIKQTKLMIQVVEAQISPALYTISIIHFLASLLIFVWAVVFL